MTLSTLAAGVAIVCFTTLLSVLDKDYEKQKDKFENSN